MLWIAGRRLVVSSSLSNWLSLEGVSLGFGLLIQLGISVWFYIWNSAFHVRFLSFFIFSSCRGEEEEDEKKMKEKERKKEEWAEFQMSPHPLGPVPFKHINHIIKTYAQK